MIHATIEGKICTKYERIERLQNNRYYQSAPKSYVTNKDAEELCIALAKEFESYNNTTETQLEPSKAKALIIVADNEFGVSKCVCTTLKPELLPYPELYDVDGCSGFISKYMEYEPLHDPCQPPMCLPSPSQVLSWGIGDCFDLSVLLASFLIGSGYDAYVVYGVAPKWICTRDRSHSTSRFKMMKTNVEARHGDLTDVRETVEELKSLFGEKPLYEDQDEIGQCNVIIEEDPLHDKRIHCWVAVKGNLRSQPGTPDIFVEPSTGDHYGIQNGEHPYLKIFALWNNRNYWVNKDNCYRANRLNLDCGDTWESVFLNTSSTSDEATQEVTRKPFDPPFSWVQSLTIPKDSYFIRYQPNGHKVEYLSDKKVEYFSEGVHRQGLVERITTYNDRNMIQIDCCVEHFGKKRTDHLLRRIRLPMHLSFHEIYSPRHSCSLSQWIEKYGQRRIIKFRQKGRADGLVSHDELFGKKLVHTYMGRRDRLYERISYLEVFRGNKEKHKGLFIIATSDGSQNVNVTKIIEKFKPPNQESKERHIAKRILMLEEKKVTSEFFKLKRCIGLEDEKYEIEINEDLSPSTDCHEQDIMNDEKSTVSSLRILNQEVMDIVRMRKHEEDVVRVDFTNNKDDIASMNVETTTSADPKEENLLPSHLEYLSLFLLPGQDLNSLTIEEAHQVSEFCLSSCRDRLLQRANIMQNRLSEERIKLAETEAKLVENDGNISEATKQALEKTVKQIVFRINILDKRLNDHETSSVEKYKELEAKLKIDLKLDRPPES